MSNVIRTGRGCLIGWTDITSYTSEERQLGKLNPKTFQREVAWKSITLRFVVTRHIHLAPDEWYLRCEGVFERVTKGTAIEAQRECQTLAKAVFKHLVEEI